MINSFYKSPISPLFFKLNLHKLEDIYQLKIVKLMRLQYNMQTNKNSSINITTMSNSGYFRILSNNHNYNTRQVSNSDFFLPRIRTKLPKCKHDVNM